VKLEPPDVVAKAWQDSRVQRIAFLVRFAHPFANTPAASRSAHGYEPPWLAFLAADRLEAISGRSEVEASGLEQSTRLG
jgi:hypothetical protein